MNKQERIQAIERIIEYRLKKSGLVDIPLSKGLIIEPLATTIEEAIKVKITEEDGDGIQAYEVVIDES